jgi:hypothetical protein
MACVTQENLMETVQISCCPRYNLHCVLNPAGGMPLFQVFDRSARRRIGELYNDLEDAFAAMERQNARALLRRGDNCAPE